MICHSLHRLLLDDLGVKQIAAVVGGSMGGMLVLEWAYFGKDYVRSIVPIATSSKHSAWCISWGEAQRQSIYADPKYDDGYYSLDDQPAAGLGAARMAALLTYRSRDSFESRFGRDTPDPSKRQTIQENSRPGSAHFHIHNDGHTIKRSVNSRQIRRRGQTSQGGSAQDEADHNGSVQDAPVDAAIVEGTRNKSIRGGNEAGELAADPQFHGPKAASLTGGETGPSPQYQTQSYLRYQGKKFVNRFDSNCYIAITRKLDTHDVSRGRAGNVADALAMIEQPTLVLGIESDGLFTFAEQQELADHIKNAKLGKIDSTEGHDAFLLQFEQVNKYILDFLNEVLPDIMQKEGEAAVESSVGELTKTSTFGEAEVSTVGGRVCPIPHKDLYTAPRETWSSKTILRVPNPPSLLLHLLTYERVGGRYHRLVDAELSMRDLVTLPVDDLRFHTHTGRRAARLRTKRMLSVASLGRMRYRRSHGYLEGSRAHGPWVTKRNILNLKSSMSESRRSDAFSDWHDRPSMRRLTAWPVV